MKIPDSVRNVRDSEKPAVVVTATVPYAIDQFYREIIRQYQSKGYLVYVVTSDSNGLSSIGCSDARICTIPMRRTISPVHDIVAWLRWFKLLRTVRPVAVLAGSPKASLLSLTAARLLNIPRRTYHLHGLRLEGSSGAQRWLLRGIERLTALSSQLIIAVSPSLAEAERSHRLNCGRPVAVPEMGSAQGIDPQYFRPDLEFPDIGEETGFQDTLPTAIFVGRVTSDKGLSFLAQSLAELHSSGRLVQLLVVGSTDEPDSQRLVAELLRCSQPVRVVGFKEDIRPYLAFSDFMVLPTRREGMPTVILQAAAMGVPSITTDVTGARDAVVDGSTGILTEFGNVPALADSIWALASNEHLREQLGRAGRDRVIDRFVPEKIANRVVSWSTGDMDLQSSGG